MRVTSFLGALALASSALAYRRNPQHVNKGYLNNKVRRAPTQPDVMARHENPPSYGGKPHTIIPQTEKTKKFVVNGTGIPDVNFDVGESYAGLLPISDKANSSELYFWFFPTDNADAGDEILIWLNGGPGCSSLEGLLQENGPFTWQYGTYLPVKNQYTWANLTNVVWVEQPAGTGFSSVGSSTPAPQNEDEVAEQFIGWFKNFVDTFGLHGRKVYIAGESYAGYFVPYIADAMYNASNTEYYNLQATLIYDPSTSYSSVQNDAPAVPFVEYWSNLFNFNQSFMTTLREKHVSCGYEKFLEEAFTFPPKGPLPTPPNAYEQNENCDLWDDVYNEAFYINPCWDVYDVSMMCPNLWDVLGFPGSFYYTPAGADVYFNRTDVQKAINAPIQEWDECTDGILTNDDSQYSGLSVLPRVIEKNKRTVIGHGLMDFILVANGTIAMIQNMTFNGAQGFSKGPSEWADFYVPYHSEDNIGNTAGAGVMGQYHTERGLTFVSVINCGHMQPQYQPASSYRHVEYLLGRIPSLGHVSDFTTQTGDFGN